MSALIIYSSLKRILDLPTKSIIIIVDEITRYIQKQSQTRKKNNLFAFFLPFSCNNEQFSNLFSYSGDKKQKSLCLLLCLFISLLIFFFVATKLFYLFYLCSTSRYSPLSFASCFSSPAHILICIICGHLEYAKPFFQ